jgi:hypothetical protein
MVTQRQVEVHLLSEPHNLGIEAVKAAQEWTSKFIIFESQQEVHDNYTILDSQELHTCSKA